MDREGSSAFARGARPYNIHFSPDGRRLALDIIESKNRDVWVYEWERDTFLVSFDPARMAPRMDPDGRRIAFPRRGRTRRRKPLLAASRRDGRGGALTESKNRNSRIVASEREVPGLR
jgi:Tol biopolymer transport system component